MTELSRTQRVERILASPAVLRRHPPSTAVAFPSEPADLSALFALTDGIELRDGTRILARADILQATSWIVSEKELPWGPDLLLIGEREEQVIVRDLDLAGQRAQGGVLEAAADALTAPCRVAIEVLGYLEDRARIPGDRVRSPEHVARDAVARRDASAIEAALARGFYPGADAGAAHAALTLGTIRATEGDGPGAMAAFEIAVASRIRAVPRGAERAEASAAWRTCAIAAERSGAAAVATLCRARSAR